MLHFGKIPKKIGQIRVEEGYFAHVSYSSRLAPPSDPVRLNQTLDLLAVLWSQAIHSLTVYWLGNVQSQQGTAFLDSLCSDESLFSVPNSFPDSPFLPWPMRRSQMKRKRTSKMKTSIITIKHPWECRTILIQNCLLELTPDRVEVVGFPADLLNTKVPFEVIEGFTKNVRFNLIATLI